MNRYSEIKSYLVNYVSDLHELKLVFEEMNDEEMVAIIKEELDDARWDLAQLLGWVDESHDGWLSMKETQELDTSMISEIVEKYSE